MMRWQLLMRRRKHVSFDVCAYNIWINSCVAKEDAEEIERVFAR
jgi:pentatricopeptide repeat protein